MKVLGLILARGGSKGIPNKNLKLLNSKPLIAHTIEEGLKSKYIDRLVVSTDDAEISNTSKAYGANVPCLRPENLATDNSPSIDSVIHMVNYLKNNDDYLPDYVCLLQCTSPLKTVADIDGCIEKIIKTQMDGCAAICEAEVNPYWTNILENDQLKYFIKEGKTILRRQDLPKIYRLNGAIYVVKTAVLLNELTLEPEKSTGYEMDSRASIDIDDIIDFKLAELLMKERELNEKNSSCNRN